MELTDAQLIAACRLGDDEALADLVRRHLGPVYAFVRRIVADDDDADDVAQETFVRAWRNLGVPGSRPGASFDLQKKFRPWILTIAKHAALDFLKKKKSLPFSAFDREDGTNAVEDNIADTAPLPPEIIERQDAGIVLAAALTHIAPASREILILHYHEQLTFEEIAEILEEPMNTVKSKHRRALIQLRKLLEGDVRLEPRSAPKSPPLS